MIKLKNKKGFTLVELLAVIALVAVLAGLAVPNIISSINNSRKNTFLLDAKRIASKAQYLLSENRTIKNDVRNGNNKIYSFNELNVLGEFDTDADGGEFDSDSFVSVSYNNYEFKYCVCLIGSKRQITGSSGTCDSSSNTPGIGCVLSDSLTEINLVTDRPANNEND